MIVVADHRALVYVCRMAHPTTWWCLHIIPKCVVLLIGVYLTYQIRHIHHNFNEVR